MISEKAVRSLYKFFNIPEHQYVESIKFVNRFNGWWYWQGIPFNELQFNIKRRLLEQRRKLDTKLVIQSIYI